MSEELTKAFYDRCRNQVSCNSTAFGIDDTAISLIILEYERFKESTRTEDKQSEQIKELEAKVFGLETTAIEYHKVIAELEQQLLTAQADGIDGVIREYERSQMSIASKPILVIPALINFMKEHASNIRNKASEGE